jgi:neutral ceramidase
MKKSSIICIPRPRILPPLNIIRLPRFILLLLITLTGARARACDGPQAEGDSSLRAGTAKVNITPATDEPIHDSIYARSLVLEGDGVRIAFVAVDLAVFTSPRIEKVCREKYGISQVMLCSSHNHSEPQPQGKRSFQAGNPFAAFYEDRIIEAVGEAVRTLFPARIAAGRKTFPQLGFNRLIVREDGHARESWFSDNHYTSENPERIPFGPVDPEVGVIRIDDAKGQPRAILMNYACHADIVCFNYAVSADYPGIACRKVEEAFGNQVTCLFVQGAGGNVESLQISSRRKGPDDPFQTDYAPMVRTGELLAFQAIKLAKSLSPSTGGQDIRFMEDSLHFTGRFDTKLDYTVHLSTLLINKDIAIAACPGELFAQLSLDWKKQMELAEVQPFLFGYTWSEGSWPGYVADVRSAALGGYGADQGSTLIEPGAGEAMMTRQLIDFYRLNSLMRDKPGPVGFKAGSQWVIKPFEAGSPNK